MRTKEEARDKDKRNFRKNIMNSLDNDGLKNDVVQGIRKRTLRVINSTDNDSQLEKKVVIKLVCSCSLCKSKACENEEAIEKYISKMMNSKNSWE